MYLLCLVFARAAFASSDHAPTLLIPVVIYQEHREAAEQLVYANDCTKINDYQFRNQILTELVLICQALHLGGVNPEFEFHGAPSLARARRTVESQDFAMTTFTLWGRDIEDQNYFVSPPTLAVGQFEKGIYTSQVNAEIISNSSLQALKEMTAAVGRGWDVDIEALECLGAGHEVVARYPQMLKMVDSNRLDFILHNMANHPDLHQVAFGVTLVPVEGYKVILNDSLHFAINKNFKKAKELNKALTAGLKELRRRNTFEKAYGESGFFNSKTKDWIQLGCGFEPP